MHELSFLAKTPAILKLSNGETDVNGVSLVQVTLHEKIRLERTHDVTYDSKGNIRKGGVKAFVFSSLEKFAPEFSTGTCEVAKVEYKISSISRKLDERGHLDHIEMGLI